MGGVHIYRSNRVESLLSGLTRVVAQPLPDPLESECIVVQGRGMERWLSLALADRLGVLANPDFPFLRAFLRDILGKVLEDDPALPGRPRVDDAFEPARLMWSIAELLGELADARSFRPVKDYLAGETRGEKALALARRIADSFDHYAIYRPEWVLAWERGESAPEAGLSQRDEAWQAELWRALVARHGSVHLARRIEKFLAVLGSGSPVPDAIPSRISLFGVATLPPLFLSALGGLGKVTEMHLFVLSPSREYWGQIRSAREQIRERRARGEAPGEMHFEEGHPLLASLGRLGRDFQEIIEASIDYREDDEDLYRDPLSESDGPGSMLHVLQSDILHLRDRGGFEAGEPPLPLAPGDRSIQVHACHGPMREAEILRDQLLDLFENDPSLEPRDVIVMTPDVDTYAPFIEAAFGSEAGDAGHQAIPCRVADRGARSVFEVVEAFFRLLDALAGRLSASSVLDLLGAPCIRERFGLGEADEPILRDWILGAGVGWGIDADHRVREGQPRAEENTWRFGLDRLFLGYAMADGPESLFSGVRPQEGAQGAEAALLGRLGDFTRALFDFHGRVEKPLRPAQWRGLLAALVESMIETDSETAHQRQLILEALDEVVRAAEQGKFEDELSLTSMREQLEAGIADKRPSGGFLVGGVTFCELVPMRTVPFRVVCLMGLGDTEFPRIRRRLGFDLIGRRPRPGDRSSREDDRYLFLEALLSARDYFLVTYKGQNPRDNESLPPSVVVGELLDHLDRAFVLDGEGGEARTTREVVTVAHRLQPFNPVYFSAREGDARLFSYSATGCAGAVALAAPRSEPNRFIPVPLPEPADTGDALELDELIDFYRNPARSLLRNRLRIFLAEDGDAAPDREPTGLDGLDRWRVGDELVARRLRDESSERDGPRIRGLGILPLGAAGRVAYEGVEHEVESLAARAREISGGGAPETLEFDLREAGLGLVGRLDGIWDGVRVHARFSRLEGTWEIEEWIRHLALCAARPEGGRALTHLVARPPEKKKKGIHVRFGFVDDAGAQLENLVAIYRRGQSSPLPFFPRTSRKYALTLRTSKKENPEEQAIKDAYSAWRSDDANAASGQVTFWSRGEEEDVHFARVFAGQDPLAVSWLPDPGTPGDGFRSLARRVFDPLLAHREGVD